MIYLIVESDYEGYRVKAAFSSREKADAALASFPLHGIEEVPLDPKVAPAWTEFWAHKFVTDDNVRIYSNPRTGMDSLQPNEVFETCVIAYGKSESEARSALQALLAKAKMVVRLNLAGGANVEERAWVIFDPVENIRPRWLSSTIIVADSLEEANSFKTKKV